MIRVFLFQIYKKVLYLIIAQTLQNFSSYTIMKLKYTLFVYIANVKRNLLNISSETQLLWLINILIQKIVCCIFNIACVVKTCILKDVSFYCYDCIVITKNKLSIFALCCTILRIVWCKNALRTILKILTFVISNFSIPT